MEDFEHNKLVLNGPEAKEQLIELTKMIIMVMQAFEFSMTTQNAGQDCSHYQSVYKVNEAKLAVFKKTLHDEVTSAFGVDCEEISFRVMKTNGDGHFKPKMELSELFGYDSERQLEKMAKTTRVLLWEDVGFGQFDGAMKGRKGDDDGGSNAGTKGTKRSDDGTEESIAATVPSKNGQINSLESGNLRLETGNPSLETGNPSSEASANINESDVVTADKKSQNFRSETWFRDSEINVIGENPRKAGLKARLYRIRVM